MYVSGSVLNTGDIMQRIHKPYSIGQSQSSALNMPVGCGECQVSSVASGPPGSLIYSIIAGIIK